MSRKNRFTVLGEYFGYPPCCVSWFNKRHEGLVTFHLTRSQEWAEEGEGFIPCPSCAEKVVAGDVKLKDLIRDRICPTPYPERDLEMVLEYCKKHNV